MLKARETNREKAMFFTIRLLGQADKSAFFNLQDVIEDVLPQSQMYVSADRLFYDICISKGAVIGVFEKNRLVAVGCCVNSDDISSHLEQQISCYRRYPEDITYEYHHIMVHPDYRGSGLQVRIMRELEQICRDRHVRFMVATVSPLNIYSRRNIERCGFVHDSDLVYHNYDRELYVKRLEAVL